MAWLVVITVGLLLVGSTLWLLPSPRERYQMELRRVAMEAGLQVRLRKLEVPGDREPRDCAVYTLRRGHHQVERFEPRLHAWQLVRGETAFLDPVVAGWSYLVRPEETAAVPLAALAELPATVTALASSRDGISVYWDERGDADSVRGFAALLAGLLAAQD